MCIHTDVIFNENNLHPMNTEQSSNREEDGFALWGNDGIWTQIIILFTSDEHNHKYSSTN